MDTPAGQQRHTGVAQPCRVTVMHDVTALRERPSLAPARTVTEARDARAHGAHTNPLTRSHPRGSIHRNAAQPREWMRMEARAASRARQPARSGELRIGISGWRYQGWRGRFYPKGLAQRRELEFAAAQFPSIELNGSFYSLQRPESYLAWKQETPPGFVFAVKGGRYITHMLRLRNVETALANFFASGVLALEEKLGPILWQLPPALPFDERLARFLAQLPRDTRAAARLAKQHDARLSGRSWTEVSQRRPLRHALEVRHPSFQSPELIALLRQHQVALVVADSAGKFPYLEDVTADFMYLRLHGDAELYTSGYSPQALALWAARIRAWRGGKEPRGAVRVAARSPVSTPRDVYVYFDNDAKVHAPYDAHALGALLGKAPASAPNAREPATRAAGARAPARRAARRTERKH